MNWINSKNEEERRAHKLPVLKMKEGLSLDFYRGKKDKKFYPKKLDQVFKINELF